MTTAAPPPGPDDTTRDRFRRGSAVLAEIHGGRGQRVLDELSGIAPALAEHVVAHAFGDVYARPGLSRRQRQLVTLSLLTAQGDCDRELEVHLNAALNVGLRPEEIVELITQAAVYCGFPRALNAAFIAKRVFAERGVLPADGVPTGPASTNGAPGDAMSSETAH